CARRTLRLGHYFDYW
nr:immunoglobulin heavy chain junction region [Macaca mulatta]MOW98112.1 immunoglobulin heavy chain junction region [Macaca mulatta]MOW98283.1 immunoglobulin heavy chain junction region [Macaca mulatta]MOW98733.1 immunoglobulin heavy chain junction region [Macaca mulatta]MOW99182.1 immunoglobulin heavy chain junction region [Macaca mulatta]